MTLDELLKKAAADFSALSPEAQAAWLKQQRASWPKAKFRWKNGVKVYESYEEYGND